MDPQRYIRDLSVRKTPKGIMRTLLVVSGDIPLHDDVVGFCEYGVAVETTDEHEGVYQISYIATALKVRGTHLGDTLLSSVIVRLRDDAWRFNRTPLVLTQVDPRNKPSMDLFTRFGFMDEGPDPDDPEYHLLSLEFTPQERGNYFGSTLAFFCHFGYGFAPCRIWGEVSPFLELAGFFNRPVGAAVPTGQFFWLC